MTVYQFISETGDRRTALFKAIAAKYDSLCKKDGAKMMETKEAALFANMDIEEAKKILTQ